MWALLEALRLWVARPGKTVELWEGDGVMGSGALVRKLRWTLWSGVDGRSVSEART